MRAPRDRVADSSECDDVGVAERPSGTTTFLFTDIEGSTQLWEAHPQEMRVALERHDEILRAAVERHRGYVFSTAGDAFAVAFAAAADAVGAAVEAQLQLGAEEWPENAQLRVRMGLHTGEAQERAGDYFGPVLNRAARIMSAGHGGQIIIAAATRDLVAGIEVVDLGQHRLKDLADQEHLFQVVAAGLLTDFSPLRTMNLRAGNLPAQATSFVGREAQIAELVGLLRANSLVTLTGVGGVGKTRLAVQAGAEMIDEFEDGVWIVELAPIADPLAVPEAVAAVFGVNAQDGRTVTESLVEALAGRQMLLVLDNCEHVLDAVAQLLEELLAVDSGLRFVATSREGLQVAAERLFAVGSLSVRDGISSAAADLFAERATAVAAGFDMSDDATAEAVIEICERLDGIPLAIELAAARMMSMTAGEVRDRLDDRFRLLSGARRGLERHQTLRHAVAWSYDLLSADERAVLDRCSTFSDGFDLDAATHVCSLNEDLDEYAVLDVLHSLVRKSLVIADQSAGRSRYTMLETIRQFAEEQLGLDSESEQTRDRHMGYFATRVIREWERWEGPEFRDAVDWLDAEMANLRSAFRWAVDRSDLDAATAISAHAVVLGFARSRLEPVSWVEEILESATAADVRQLPRLYTSAAQAMYTGRPDAAVAHAETAIALESDPRYDPFEPGWTRMSEASGYVYTDRLHQYIEIVSQLADAPGPSRVYGLAALISALEAAGRGDEARSLAEESVARAREHANPCWIAFALWTYGLAFAKVDPVRASIALREGLQCAQQDRVSYFQATIARDLAGLEVEGRDVSESLELFEIAVSSLYLAGNHAQLIITLSTVATFFERIGRQKAAAVIIGALDRQPSTRGLVPDLGRVGHLVRSNLGEAAFERCVADQAVFELGPAARYAERQLREALAELSGPPT